MAELRDVNAVLWDMAVQEIAAPVGSTRDSGSIEGSAVAHTAQNIDLDAPTLPDRPGARFVVHVSNGIAQIVNIQLQNKVGSVYYNVGSSVNVAASTAQGWLADAGFLNGVAGRVVVDPAANGTGTVTVTITCA